VTAANVLAVALVHALPWYFGFAVFVVWAGAALGFTLLFRRRMRARADRRLHEADRSRAPRHTPPTGPIRDDRSLGSGGDIQPW
jgi:membrane protein implicated in regulation of membrane protease activity